MEVAIGSKRSKEVQGKARSQHAEVVFDSRMENEDVDPMFWLEHGTPKVIDLNLLRTSKYKTTKGVAIKQLTRINTTLHDDSAGTMTLTME